MNLLVLFTLEQYYVKLRTNVSNMNTSCKLCLILFWVDMLLRAHGSSFGIRLMLNKKGRIRDQSGMEELSHYNSDAITNINSEVCGVVCQLLV